jgi:hypothetical protein
MRDDVRMRTTLDLDQDILLAAKDIASVEKKSVGRVISDLVRRSLRPKKHLRERNGFRLLPKNPNGMLVTMELVNRLRDEDP